ncbi:MAG: YmdB family metallophosphoesterase, partial [Gaiellales bacterium]
MRILFIADAFAAAGRRIIEERLPAVRREREIDFVIANAENIADGVGITSRLARRLLGGGVDVITLGNHAYRQREVYPYLDQEERILRPVNYPESAPGHGTCVVAAEDGTRVAVINLIGSLFLDATVSPFAVAERLVETARKDAPVVVVDFHAEATSEKVAMGHLLAGRATA